MKNKIYDFEASMEKGLNNLSQLPASIQRDVIEFTFEDLMELKEADEGQQSDNLAKQASRLAVAVRNAVSTNEPEILSRIEHDVRLRVREIKNKMNHVIPMRERRAEVA